MWAPDVSVGRVRIPPWLVFFIAAAISALAYGVITWVALLALGGMLGTSVLSQRVDSRAVGAALAVLAALFALALALHLVPGFSNPVVVDRVQLGPDGAPFTQRANFDKATAGLFLLVFFCQRIATRDDWRSVLAPTAIAIVATVVVVMGLALSTGYVRPDLKLPTFAPAFLAINLLFTVVAEEAFFRGMVQERLTRAVAAHPRLQWIPVGVSSASFGLAHLAGGPLLVLFATIAGIGYSLAYAATRRIEAPMLTHFAVNAVHFFGFTYPHLQR